MTFESEILFDATVAPESLKQARKDVEDELTADPLEVQVDVQTQSGSGGGGSGVGNRRSRENAYSRKLLSRQNDTISSHLDVAQKTQELDEYRNVLLEELVEASDSRGSSGSSGIRGKLPSGGGGSGGGLLGGALGLLGLLGLAGTAGASMLEIEEPDFLPPKFPEPDWLPPEVPKPDWLPIVVQLPGSNDSPSPSSPPSGVPNRRPSPGGRGAGGPDPSPSPRGGPSPTPHSPGGRHVPGPFPDGVPSPTGRPGDQPGPIRGPSPSDVATGVGVGLVAQQAREVLTGVASGGSSPSAGSGVAPIGIPSMAAGQWLERKKREMFGNTSIEGTTLASATPSVGGNRARGQRNSKPEITVQNDVTVDASSLRELQREFDKMKRDTERELKDFINREFTP